VEVLVDHCTYPQAMNCLSVLSTARTLQAWAQRLLELQEEEAREIAAVRASAEALRDFQLHQCDVKSSKRVAQKRDELEDAVQIQTALMVRHQGSGQVLHLSTVNHGAPSGVGSSTALKYCQSWCAIRGQDKYCT
jgi:hypothetical protein